ncbi:hypothetical protein PF005_g6780 [Phytophthora fragariae]|uniref:Acyltransferase 3 domain-containing protein n=2 Tax=Phytophthora TaxID=4783 RepID=A0A6A3FFR9_9STRA|nr:hypothetical protein PF003_g28114 [Phytophthora fragariae]KAE9036638.1 hypothetical protein PR002_g6983 [Phytophthora rubi]KAE8942890.1 hypothetical protein PF009_g7355 [Phytophthora fragariae]KAE9018621.1 hypothetical protein PF011_g6191 [Phytophthora fragariae]KAE9041437.1 hypothetical protein PR001_g6604 [Phytophthora rubi]
MELVIRSEIPSKTEGHRSAAPVFEYDRVPGDSSAAHLRCDATLVVVSSEEDTVDVEKVKLQDAQDEQKRERGQGGKVKLKFLNGLRGIASLLVVHTHAGYLKESTIAPSGVDIFFVLSAFLLTMLNESKINKLVSRRDGPRQWLVTLADYFIKRLVRVYPLFATVAFVLTCMPEETRTHYYNLAHYNIQHWSIWEILTFEHRYYLFWTLPIEIGYYFIIPIFLVGVCLLGKYKWVAIAPLYVWVYYEGMHTSRGAHDRFRLHLPTFLAGSLAAVVYSELNKWVKERRFEPRIWQLSAIRGFEFLMICCVLANVSRGDFKSWFRLFPSPDAEVPSVSLPISATIVIETLFPSAISRGLEWNFLCYSGKISFSMYLLHPFVNFQPFLTELPRIDQFIVRIVLVYALATTSYFLIERNCQRLGVNISKKLARFGGSAPARVEIASTTSKSFVARLIARLRGADVA